MVETGVTASRRSADPASSSKNGANHVVYSQDGVSAKMGEESDEVTNVNGRLTIVEKNTIVYIEWTPMEDGNDMWVNVSPAAVSYSPAHDSADISSSSHRLSGNLARLAFSVELKDIRSYYSIETSASSKRRASPSAPPSIKLIGVCGAAYIPLYFHPKLGNEHIAHFNAVLQKYVELKRSSKEKHLILITDERKEDLERSMHALFQKEPQPFFAKLTANPIGTTISTLGRVGQMVHNQMYDVFVDTQEVDADEHRAAMLSLIKQAEHDRDESDSLRCHEDPAGFELITKLTLPTRPDVVRESPLDEESLKVYTNDDGSYSNVRQLKTHIFRGGISPSLRRRLWPLVLGAADWSDTDGERTAKREEAVDFFYRMKLQWKSINDDQETRFQEFANRKSLIEKDVHRTDRTLRHFKGDNNTNVQTLNDILMTYVMYNFDLGYVQGMSDFLSPILFVMDNEVDAFWCFVALMRRVNRNFEMDQSMIREQLMQLRDLLMVVTPKLANYLESHDSDNMYFTFRWLLVHFKREFSFGDIQRLWEVLWTQQPCLNFHLLICVAILDRQSAAIIQNKFGLTEILKHINDLSMHIDVEETLSTAEAIYHQLAASQDVLPPHICDILGFEAAHSDGQLSSADGTPEHTA